jgi:hypothetical protein
LPSGLPDELLPRAERMFPRFIDGVGISVNAPEHRRDLAGAIREAMEIVVEDHYADGVRDPTIIKPRMMEARRRIHKM